MSCLLYPGPPSSHPGPNFPALFYQVLSPELMARAQQKQLQRQEVIREFERFPGDTGSTEVQGE